MAWCDGGGPPTVREVLESVAAEYERLEADNSAVRSLLPETMGAELAVEPLAEPPALLCVQEAGFVQLPAETCPPMTPGAKSIGSVNSECASGWQVAQPTLSGMPCDAEEQQSVSQTMASSRSLGTWNGAAEKMAVKAQNTVKPLFPNHEDMKSMVRKHLNHEKKFTVYQYYKADGCAQRIATHPWFEKITLIIISLNALWIGIDTDFNSADVLIDAHPTFMVAEQSFCAFFTLELLIRFLAFESKLNCFRDAWFIFDFCLVLFMIVESWLMTAFMLLMSSDARTGGKLIGNATILKVAKLLRMMRMLRISRLLRRCPEFFILAKAMVTAMRAVCFTLAFLIIIIYVFSICFTSLLRDTAVGKEKFDSVLSSMQYLFFHVALFDEVTVLVAALEATSWIALFLMYILAVLGGITVMNMLIGVLCEAIAAIAASERTALHVARVHVALQKIMDSDYDGAYNDGLISKQEFERMIQSSEAVFALEDVGVDVLGLVDIADTIFAKQVGTKEEKYDKQLTIPQFMEVLLQLRGSNKATVKDIVELRKEIHRTLRKLDTVRAHMGIVDDLSAVPGRLSGRSGDSGAR